MASRVMTSRSNSSVDTTVSGVSAAPCESKIATVGITRMWVCRRRTAIVPDRSGGSRRHPGRRCRNARSSSIADAASSYRHVLGAGPFHMSQSSTLGGSLSGAISKLDPYFMLYDPTQVYPTQLSRFDVSSCSDHVGALRLCVPT